MSRTGCGSTLTTNHLLFSGTPRSLRSPRPMSTPAAPPRDVRTDRARLERGGVASRGHAWLSNRNETVMPAVVWRVEVAFVEDDARRSGRAHRAFLSAPEVPREPTPRLPLARSRWECGPRRPPPCAAIPPRADP